MTDRQTAVTTRTKQTTNRTQTQQPSSGSTGIYNDEDLKAVDVVTRFTHTLLKPGFSVKGADGSRMYNVCSVLCFMPYGDIYKVQDVQKRVFTMKTENDTLHSKLGGMKKEVEILEYMKGNTDKKKGKHFPLMLDRACAKGQLKYVIYKRMGTDLETIRRTVISRNFSPSTAMRISLMILRTISDLHSLGFVHRDIRLAHFWVGTGEDFQNIYLMDFSKVRKFRTEDGNIRPRQKTSDCVYNVHKYLSRRAQKGQDTGPRDDLESWIYVTLDVFAEGCLPWKRDRTRKKMLRRKKAVMNDQGVRANISKVVHPAFWELLQYVNELKWETEIRFDVLESAMIGICDVLDLQLSSGVDWSGNAGDTVLPPLTRPHIEVGADMMEEETKSDELTSGGKKGSKERRSKSRVRVRRTVQVPSEMESSSSTKPKHGNKKKRVVNEDDEDNEDDDDESFQGTTNAAGGGGKNYIRSSGILAGVAKYQRPAKQEAKENDYDNVVWTAHQEAAALAAAGAADGAADAVAAPAAVPASTDANKQQPPSRE